MRTLGASMTQKLHSKALDGAGGGALTHGTAVHVAHEPDGVAPDAGAGHVRGCTVHLAAPSRRERAGGTGVTAAP